MYLSFMLKVNVVVLVCCITRVHLQGAGEAQGGGFVPPGFEEVTTKAPGDGGLGAIERCGEGESQGKTLCVPYFQCDGATKTIIQDGSQDGVGLIDIRFGAESPCEHYLDVCCKIPEGGVPPPVSSSTEPDQPPSFTVPQQPPEDPNNRYPMDNNGSNTKPAQEWTCGIRNNNGVDFKITGNLNHEAEYGEFPWMVAIVKANFRPGDGANLLICGASLIAADVVVTGAHCVYKLKTSDIKVRAGEWDTQTEKERLPYQERNIKQIIIHEKFNPQSLFNDIALLILETPVEEAEHIGTICLPEQGQVFNAKECIATGWGKHKFGAEGVYQAILKKLILPTVAKPECQERLRKTRLGKYFILDKSFMCAGGQKELDTCEGDGGSPFVCPDPTQPHRYIQAGIVAWGIGCGLEIPAVYVDVSQFKKWIDDKIIGNTFSSNN